MAKKTKPNTFKNLRREREKKGTATPTPTGRFAEDKPAIQNIPVRTPEGAEIKKALKDMIYDEWGF